MDKTEDNNKVKRRIKAVIEDKGLRMDEVLPNIGVKDSSSFRSPKIDTAILSSAIEKFLSLYTDVSAEYIMRGIGDMYNNSNVQNGDNNKQYNFKNESGDNFAGDKNEGVNIMFTEKASEDLKIINQYINDKAQQGAADENVQRAANSLNREIEMLRELVSSQKKTIESQSQTIELYKHIVSNK